MNLHDRNLTVGSHMTAEPVVVAVDAPLAEAARLIDERGVSGLPVVDRSGALVGVVSQTDLARARTTEYLWANWPGLAVRHLMTAPAVTVTASIPLTAAVRKMEKLHIHRLVVVEDADPSMPIGVLSLTDVVHAITAELTHRGPSVRDGSHPSAMPTEAPRNV